LAVFITPKILYSREELTTMGRREELRSSYTLLDQTSITTASQKIYEQAVNMDEGKGLESVRKTELFRKSTAIGYYEVIYRSFPESPIAPEAMYRAGMIHWKYFKQFKKAKGLFANVISDYPDSPFSDKARKNYKDIEQQEIQKKKKMK
jgi:outer membrane protein assembly factor BamD (BamD/ComL family)